MNTTKCAVLERNQKITVKEIQLSEMQPDECEVSIKSAGLCSSDIARGFGGGAYFYPLVMGHELAGEIMRIGEDVDGRYQVGGRVCVFPLIPCFNCQACEQKMYALCSDYDYYGSRRHGGFSEKLNVKEWNLLKLPNDVSLDDGALVEPMAVVYHAIEKLMLDYNVPRKICIFGAGFLGLIAVQIIGQLYPKCEVVLVDRNLFKLDIGARFGATSCWVGDHEAWESFLLEYEGEFDRVLELVGTPDTFCAAIHVASPLARVLWAGNISGDLSLTKTQVSSILRKEITIVGTWNSIYKGRAVCDWTRSLELMSKGLKPSKLISLRIGLEGIEETLSKLYAHKKRKAKFDIIKVLVNPGLANS